MSLTVKNAPIKELMCGFIFSSIDFNPIYQGAYWAKIKDEFPTVQVASPVGSSISLNLIGPSPVRTLAKSKDNVSIIQYQNNAFRYNWRHTNSKDDYPRFSQIMPTAIQHFMDFKDHLQKEFNLNLELDSLEILKNNVLNLEKFQESKIGNLADNLGLDAYSFHGKNTQDDITLELEVQYKKDVNLINKGIIKIDKTDKPEDKFTKLNDFINDKFMTLFPKWEKE
ncbi:MAG: hypothetical protein NE334_12525 [Lentisphaeraceae bacterium]|nr:hypothetical protein [Lentisphaeraceae bacterium]